MSNLHPWGSIFLPSQFLVSLKSAQFLTNIFGSGGGPGPISRTFASGGGGVDEHLRVLFCVWSGALANDTKFVFKFSFVLVQQFIASL